MHINCVPAYKIYMTVIKRLNIANPVSHDTDGAETPNVSTALEATGSVDVKRNSYIPLKVEILARIFVARDAIQGVKYANK